MSTAHTTLFPLRRTLTAVLWALGIAGVSGCTDGDEAAKMQRLESENAALRRTVGGQSAYNCQVLDVRELQDDGMLVEAAPAFRAQAVGAKFVVNRETGVIAGTVGGNGTFDSRVVTFTPPGNPFYVVSTTRAPHRNVEYLSIRDWAEGPPKPFLLAESTNVFTGTCRE